MTVQLGCPVEEVLHAYACGNDSEIEALIVEEHLSSCGRCLNQVALAGADDVMEALRSSTHTPFTSNAALERIRQDFRTRRPRIMASDATLSQLAEATPTRSPNHAEMALDLPEADANSGLSPPRGHGEIGRLAAWKVIRKLGEGGMGVVYEAEDEVLRRRIAIKVMRPSLAADPEARHRFLREGRAMASLTHDHIVSVFGVGEEKGAPYLAMPLLTGESLQARAERVGRLPMGEVIRIGREVALALAAAHEARLIHRDIKPANLWLEMPSGRIKVLDFGLARPGDGDELNTVSGAIIGTPAYMAPEQTGDEVDHRVDLFALGAVLYRLVSGRAPFLGLPMEILRKSLHEPIPPVRTLNPEVPSALAELIDRLLSKNPADRPCDALSVARELEGIAGRVMESAPVHPMTGVPVRRSGRNVRLLLAAALILVVVGLAFGAAWQFGQIEQKGPEAVVSPVVFQDPPRTESGPGKKTETTKPMREDAIVSSPTKLSGLDSWNIKVNGTQASPSALTFKEGNKKIYVWLNREGWMAYDVLLDRLVEPPYKGKSVTTCSRDGKLLLISNGVNYEIWKNGENRPYRTLEEDARYFPSFSPTNDQLAFIAPGDDFYLWDIKENKKICSYAKVSGFSWSPDGGTIAYNDLLAMKTVYISSRQQGKILKVVDRPNQLWEYGSFSSDGKRFAYSNSPDGKATILNRDGAEAIVLSGKTGFDIRWSPDGKQLAYCIDDDSNSVRVWAGNCDKQLFDLKGHKKRVTGIAFSDDGKTILTWSRDDKTIRSWDSATGRHVATLVIFGPDCGIVVSAEGHYRALGGAEKNLIFEAKPTDGELVDSLKADEFAAKYKWTNDPSKVRFMPR